MAFASSPNSSNVFAVKFLFVSDMRPCITFVNEMQIVLHLTNMVDIAQRVLIT